MAKMMAPLYFHELKVDNKVTSLALKKTTNALDHVSVSACMDER